MKQFRKILKFELKNYLANKVFVGVTLFLVLLITGVMFFPRIMEQFDRQEPSDVPEDRSILLLVSDAPEHEEMLLTAFREAFPEYDVQPEPDPNRVTDRISSGEAECAVVLDTLTSYTYYVENLSMYDFNTDTVDEVLRNQYRIQAMADSGIPPEEAGAILSAEIVHESRPLGQDQMQNFFYTYIMIFALYMVILLYGQMVATNVATEKSSRAMELLITSAKPVSMMFGKVLASCLAGLAQLVAVFGSALVFYRLNEGYWDGNGIVASIFAMPVQLLIYMLVFFVLGFLIYAFLYGAVGSTASKLEDINTAVMPITMLFIIAFFVVMFSLAGNTVDTLLMKVCSYIPFTSPMAMFTRIAMSTVPLWEIVLSIAILVVSVFAVGVLSAKIYRVGVLLYGTPPKPAALLRAIRRS